VEVGGPIAWGLVLGVGKERGLRPDVTGRKWRLGDRRSPERADGLGQGGGLLVARRGRGAPPGGSRFSPRWLRLPWLPRSTCVRPSPGPARAGKGG